MNRFASILLPLDGSSESAKGAGCALWLAGRLDAMLHVLHVTAEPLPTAEALVRLHVPDTGRARVVLHQAAGNAQAAVLEAIADYHAELVVMSARGLSVSMGLEPGRRLGSIARGVIERSPAPVLLLPVHYRESLPWTSMLAALSGEPAADRALETAVHLASALRLEVNAVHCEDAGFRTAAAPLGAYADEPYYEYPYRLEEMVERGLAGCAAEKTRCRIHKALLCRGDPARVLLEETARLGSGVIALGWHGSLAAGRAPVLKRLLDEARCALLIARANEYPHARLKTGNEFDEA